MSTTTSIVKCMFSVRQMEGSNLEVNCCKYCYSRIGNIVFLFLISLSLSSDKITRLFSFVISKFHSKRNLVLTNNLLSSLSGSFSSILTLKNLMKKLGFSDDISNVSLFYQSLYQNRIDKNRAHCSFIKMQTNSKNSTFNFAKSFL